MDKKLVVAIVLSMVVLLGYPYIIKMIYPPQEQAKTTAVDTAQKAAPSQAPDAAPAPKPAAETLKESFVTVDTPLYRAVFSTIGGGVKSFELKKYPEAIGSDKPVNVAEKVARLNSFKTVIKTGGTTEEIALSPSRQSLTISGTERGDLIFTGMTGGGLTVEKRYTFSADDYFIETSQRFTNTSGAPVAASSETVINAVIGGKDDAGYHLGPIAYTKEKLIRPADGEAEKRGSSDLSWIGIEDKYFLAAMLFKPDNQINWSAVAPSVTSSKASIEVPLSLAPDERKEVSYRTFLGPKEYDLLLKQKIGLEEAIEFGWFDFMAKPFLVVLNFFKRYLVNYGIAIIVLTVIIKILFYPLTKHSLKSMKDMQTIQPQMAALKEKYKNDKDKLNKELMELYKRYKINPLGGCLPMVLQIPVFIALYEVLYVAIELRHAPFFLWIHDLSDKDPYYITPIVMGATMFIQQKMTPTTMDPAQSKIMLIMPIVFTFMFLNFPSGLVIYWLVNNVLSIAQQYYIQRPARAKA